MQLYQKYRPRFWADYVGQDKAVAVVRRIIERDGFDRGAFWIEASGANNSGVGKTTLAWLIAGQLAGSVDRLIFERPGERFRIDVDPRNALGHRVDCLVYAHAWGELGLRDVGGLLVPRLAFLFKLRLLDVVAFHPPVI